MDKNLWTGHPQKGKGILKTLSTKWIELQPFSIDPPIIESVSIYFQ